MTNDERRAVTSLRISLSYVSTKDEIDEFIKCLRKFLEKYGKYRAFDVFGDNMYIPPEHTSKMTHTYIDDGFTEELTDYLGNTTIVEEKSFIHLEPCDFHMSMSKEFLYFLQGFLHIRQL